VGHLSVKMGQIEERQKEDDRIEWRRKKVLELSSQGYNDRDIAQILQVGKSTVNRDIQYLRQQAQENLKTHIQQKLPEEYQNCMAGMKQVLRLSWDIANN
jgi:transposase